MRYIPFELYPSTLGIFGKITINIRVNLLFLGNGFVKF